MGATRNNSHPLISARLKPSTCASIPSRRRILVQNHFLPLSTWETRCCEWVGARPSGDAGAASVRSVNGRHFPFTVEATGHLDRTKGHLPVSAVTTALRAWMGGLRRGALAVLPAGRWVCVPTAIAAAATATCGRNNVRVSRSRTDDVQGAGRLNVHLQSDPPRGSPSGGREAETRKAVGLHHKPFLSMFLPELPALSTV